MMSTVRSSRGILLALMASGLGIAVSAQEPKATETTTENPVSVATEAPPGPSKGDPCALCGVADCSGACASRLGLFAIGQPTQYVPPPSGWTLMVPPLPPPPPAPGSKPKPPQPWKTLFFDNDFRYLDKPGNTTHNTFDFFKRRRPFGDAVVSDFGGEFRWQGKVEDNRRLLGKQNNYNLFRERLYLNTWFYNRFRFYGEVYWADSSLQTLTPLPFDLIPHLVYRGDAWSADLFWSHPNIIKPGALNTPNYDQQFFGSYFTYKGKPNRLYDLYYLGLISDAQFKGVLNGETGNFQVHTLGARWQGEQENWLWEGEAA